MKKILFVILAVAICFGVGLTARFFQAESIHVWYPMLVKPDITPPDIVFPIAWGIIYLCMGLSVGLIWSEKMPKGKIALTFVFFLQLVLNFSWSINFFYLRSPLLGFANLVALDLAVVLYVLCAWFLNKRFSAWLFAPCLVWLALATYLNGYIMLYN